MVSQKLVEEEPLSLEEKMHLIIREQSKPDKVTWFWGLIFLLLFLIAFVSWINSSLLDQEINAEILSELRENSDMAMYVAIGLFGIFGLLFIADKISSKKEIKKLNELVDGFIRKSYLLNFETAIPKGTSRVDKILNEALKVFPELKEDGKIDYEKKTKNPLPLSKDIVPLSFSFSKLGDSLILDPTREEEEACETRITFGISNWNGQLMVNSCQKRGKETLTQEDAVVLTRKTLDYYTFSKTGSAVTYRGGLELRKKRPIDLQKVNSKLVMVLYETGMEMFELSYRKHAIFRVDAGLANTRGAAISALGESVR